MQFRKVRMVSIVTLAVFACPNFGALAADTSLQTVFTRMDQAAAKFKGMTADVRRVSHEGVINEDEVDTGSIAVKLPKPHDLRLLMNLKKPDPKTVELAGTKVRIYLPKIPEVQEYNFGRSNRAQIDQFLRLGFGSTSREIEEAYTVQVGGPEPVNGQPATRIVLIPKSPDLAAQFPKFELWIADATGVAIQQKIYQPGNTYELVTYSSMKLNPNIPDSAMKLHVPKGVKVTELSR
jgi:outer membrane lipoprotein-sorting protein